MAGCASRISALEIVDLRAGVATEACYRHMRADERKTRTVMLGDRLFDLPCTLLMAFGAHAAKLPFVRIDMAAAATLICKQRDGAAIVMTSQA